MKGGRERRHLTSPAPDEVRKSYIAFKQAIEEDFKRKGRNAQISLVPEPYRHINYRQLVMAPTNRPPVAQPIVAQKLPYYLTKEAVDKALAEGKEKRLDIFGKEPLRQFLADVNLSCYVEQAAVPQWIFVDEEIVQRLCSLATPTSFLNTYRQELLQHRSYHRLVLFLRCLLSTAKNADTGFIICWTIHQPAHLRYLGPSRAKNLYLLRLHDTLEILLFKFGGESLRLPLASRLTYMAREQNISVLLRHNRNVFALLLKDHGNIVLLNRDVHCGDCPTVYLQKEVECAKNPLPMPATSCWGTSQLSS